MVCNRCAMVVENILKKSEIPFQKVIIGEIHLQEAISVEKKLLLKKLLEEVGFELIDTHASGQIEKIKKFVIKKARNEVDEKDQKRNLSEYLSAHMNHEYTYLSSLFSSIEGRTIEKFFIEQRIAGESFLATYRRIGIAPFKERASFKSV